nr:receptor-like protein [Ipomoea batatas]
MGKSPPHRVDHFLIIFCTLVVMELCICGGSNNGVCKEEEMRALLCFKKESEDPMNLLSSWVDGVDCCTKWKGVVCDNVTGHVVQLQLANLTDEYYFSFPDSKGTLSPCLLELKELRHLDLSGLFKYFGGSQIPSFIGSLVNLQYLDLSYLGFRGIIPHQLGNLSCLHTLRLQSDPDVDALSCGDDTLVTKVDTLDWLLNLSNLEYLDLSSVNLSMAHKWQEVINTLPSLREIYLSCGLSKLSHSPHHNNSLLQVLDLSGNKFNTVIPRWIFNLNSLVFLDLTLCDFQGPFPNDHWNLTSLRSLNIFDNEMNGSLPNQLFSLSYLNSLDLSFNQFQGPLPSGRWNLTSLKTLSLIQNYLNSHIPDSIYHCTSLERLDLSQNKFQGILSKSISNLSSLSDLYLSNNMLTAEVPKEIGKLNKLKKFLFSNNNFYGPLPESIGHLSSLEELSFIDNMLEGIVMEKHFVNLTKLTFLYAPRNRLTLKVSPNWVPPFQLDSVSLSNWILGPQFPTWLQSQHQILDVHMSGAKIEGEIPTWFWNFSSSLDTIDLSHNQLRGAIPNILLWLSKRNISSYVYLGSNQLSGPLIHIPVNIYELDLSNNFISGDLSPLLCHAKDVPYPLEILLLGGNNLSEKIPDCWVYWPHLKFISVRENQLRGSIPNSIGLLNKLESLDAHKNMLSGHLPPSLQNCSLLLKVDLGGNGFTGEIPRWLGTSFSNLKVLRLRSNEFFGELPQTFCHLTSLHMLDLANNHFFGVIPKCLDNLTAMINIDENKNNMSDGSEIPSSFSSLSALGVLDLSYNNLSGKIPSGTQLQGFNASVTLATTFADFHSQRIVVLMMVKFLSMKIKDMMMMMILKWTGFMLAWP